MGPCCFSQILISHSENDVLILYRKPSLRIEMRGEVWQSCRQGNGHGDWHLFKAQSSSSSYLEKAEKLKSAAW